MRALGKYDILLLALVWSRSCLEMPNAMDVVEKQHEHPVMWEAVLLVETAVWVLHGQ